MNNQIIVMFVVLTSLLYITEGTSSKFVNLDNKFHLVSESYQMAKTLFIQGRNNYDQLKERSLNATDLFLDLIEILNEFMAKELRSAVVKFYRIKFLHDFSNYVINMEEIMDIMDHCLVEPVEKINYIRSQFHNMIKNFEDVRHFDTVDKCHNELPDEVAAAHCILHQAVLFNETMQESLISIVEIKTKQSAREVNSTLYEVQKCLNHFVPNFYDQLLIDAYSGSCEYLKVVNASMIDFTSDKWRNSSQTLFPKKWGNLIRNLKKKATSLNGNIQEPFYMTLFTANISLQDVVKTVYI